MYVEGNPVNLADPSGHEPWWCRILELNCPGPDTDNYSEKVPPNGITWFPESDPLVSGAVGIPQNTNAAQFLNLDYEPCDYYLADCVHYGLCGAVALSAITGIPIASIAKAYIWGKENGIIVTKDNPPDYTGSGTMTQIVNKLIGGGWSAEGNYWPNFTKRVNLPNQMYDWLSQGKFAIAGVRIISGSSRPESAEIAGKVGGGRGSPTHWVVITGMSKEWSWSQETAYINDNSQWNWVRIYNPFDNQTEYYHWEDFMQAWDNAGGMTVVLTKGYEWY